MKSALKKFIPYGFQSVDSDDVRAVVSAMRSKTLTTGPKVLEFEEKLAAYCGARFAVACSNGTAALHLACLALDLKEKENIVTSPITFLATANCARYVGAEVVFSDVEETTVNLDPTKLLKTLQRARRVKAVFPVHFTGQPADMENISRIARSKGFKIVEDACHAFGASYRTASGRTVKVGSCSHSDMTAFSFHPIKTITTGEGGAVTTNDPRLYERLLLLRNHGMQKKSKDLWAYEMNELGFNYRLTDIQCALGLSQLKKTDSFVRRRREIADFYDKQFKHTEFLKPLPAGPLSSRHLYVLRIDFEKLKKNRADVMRSLHKFGIGAQVHYIPLSYQPYYRDRYDLRRGNFPIAEKYYEQALSIPLHPSMTDADAARVIRAVKKVCSRAK